MIVRSIYSYGHIVSPNQVRHLTCNYLQSRSIHSARYPLLTPSHNFLPSTPPPRHFRFFLISLLHPRSLLHPLTTFPLHSSQHHTLSHFLPTTPQLFPKSLLSSSLIHSPHHHSTPSPPSLASHQHLLFSQLSPFSPSSLPSHATLLPTIPSFPFPPSFLPSYPILSTLPHPIPTGTHPSKHPCSNTK